MKQPGGNVQYVFLFLAGAAIMVFAVYSYFEKKDLGTYEVLRSQISKTQNEVRELQNLFVSNQETVKSFSLRAQDFEKEIKRFEEQLDVYRDQTAETLNKQIQLRDDLSKRNPIIRSKIDFNIIETKPQPKPKPASKRH